ncbi:LysM peptidoglycan-binding domain-containing protein [Fodinisporobacter ferrooxydans]|uniref:LysM peptidoglycan-binding domain-containing protein n=1 Tax=Fodinisporobacter ferrooxydans TaxID=2901836 RepID=A0ABY4CSH8_9BACL|nr:LysM peptidoglycan-binding domain-containing protein [Alicyclobacillaceae bacterium MYW30-H2]
MKLNLTHIAIAGLALCTLFSLYTGTGDAKSPVPDKPSKTYTVQGSDTLWSIVTSHHEYDRYDPRDVIYQIEKMNHMKDSTIQDGQALQLP